MHDNLHIKPQHEGDENGRLKKKREFSHFFLVLFAILAVVYVIRCAGKVRLDPFKRLMAGTDRSDLTGALIALPLYGRVPFNKWFKFIMPFMILAWAAFIVLLVNGAFIGC